MKPFSRNSSLSRDFPFKGTLISFCPLSSRAGFLFPKAVGVRPGGGWGWWIYLGMALGRYRRFLPTTFSPTFQKSENPDYGPRSLSGPKTRLSEWEEPFNVLLGRLTAVWLTWTEAREPGKAGSCGVDVDRELRAQDLVLTTL